MRVEINQKYGNVTEGENKDNVLTKLANAFHNWVNNELIALNTENVEPRTDAYAIRKQ